jgi:hypothetical protein
MRCSANPVLDADALVSGKERFEDGVWENPCRKQMRKIIVVNGSSLAFINRVVFTVWDYNPALNKENKWQWNNITSFWHRIVISVGTYSLILGQLEIRILLD